MAFVEEVCAKTFNVFHMLLFVSVKPVFHLNMTVVHFLLFFFLRRNFNIYSIKAKRAVNRMQFVVQIVIGGRPDLWSCHSEYIDIKEMQMAYLSLQTGCHKCICDNGFTGNGRPLTSNKSTEKIINECRGGMAPDFCAGFNLGTESRQKVKPNYSINVFWHFWVYSLSHYFGFLMLLAHKVASITF